MARNCAVRRPERATGVPTTPGLGPPETLPYSELRLCFVQYFLPSLAVGDVAIRLQRQVAAFAACPQNKELRMPLFYICWLGLGDYLYRFPSFDYCEAVNEALRYGPLDVWIENENGERIA
jgi:hypothetical protein